MTLNRTLLFLALISVMSVSCVSKKAFTELEAEKNDLSMKLDKLQSDFDANSAAQGEEIAKLQASNETLNNDKASLDADLQSAKSNFETQLADVKSSVDDKQRQLDALRGEINEAFADVETAVTATGARVNQIESFLYLDFEDDVNFRSGSSRVSASDDETLTSIADMLKANPSVAIIVEGHTDSRSISTANFDDNWDLSMSRAANVVRKLVKMGVNPEQLIASGRGENMPVADNTTREGREQNRRTEVIVVPNIGKLYRVSQEK